MVRQCWIEMVVSKYRYDNCTVYCSHYMAHNRLRCAHSAVVITMIAAPRARLCATVLMEAERTVTGDLEHYEKITRYRRDDVRLKECDIGWKCDQESAILELMMCIRAYAMYVHGQCLQHMCVIEK